MQGFALPPVPTFRPDRSIRAWLFKAWLRGRAGMGKRGEQASALLSPKHVAVNTINGAYNSHEEAVKGSISLGKFADFVVLSDDIFRVNQSKIKDVQIVR